VRDTENGEGGVRQSVYLNSIVPAGKVMSRSRPSTVQEVLQHTVY
jgi:hypothetical protein